MSGRHHKPAKPTIEPYHDPVARWCLDNIGQLPDPTMVKWLKPQLERLGLLLDPERYAERHAAGLLAMGDPEGGIPPFDPVVEAAQLSQRGVDVSRDPVFAKLAELAELGRKRLRGRKAPRRDPKAASRAKSAKAETKLRKAKRGASGDSKVLRRKPLRDEDRDRAILAEIHGFLRVGLGVRFTPWQRELVSPLSSSPLLPKTTDRRSTTYDPVIQLPLWSKATLPLRAMAMGVALGTDGAVDFTLHLGDSGIRYGEGVGEMQFARRLYRRITDALACGCPKEGYAPPDLFFLVEQGIRERPHLHGVIVAPAKKVHQRDLREVLCDAVGTDWKPKGRDKTQLEFGSFFEPAGWVNYMTKYVEMTKATLGDNIFASSRSVTRAGRSWYNKMRDERGLLLPGKAIETASR